MRIIERRGGYILGDSPADTDGIPCKFYGVERLRCGLEFYIYALPDGYSVVADDEGEVVDVVYFYEEFLHSGEVFDYLTPKLQWHYDRIQYFNQF